MFTPSLIAGGLSALQTMSITSALPFAIILILSAIGMWRALIIEGHREVSLQAHMQSAGPASKRGWRQRLSGLIDYPGYDEVAGFITSTVHPAMQRVEEVIKGKGWPVVVSHDETHHRAYIEVVLEDQMDFIYDIRMRAYARPSFAYPERPRESDGDERYYRAEVFLRRGGQQYNVYGYEEEEIIEDILHQFEKYLHFLHISPGILPWKMQEHDDMLNNNGSIDQA